MRFELLMFQFPWICSNLISFGTMGFITMKRTTMYGKYVWFTLCRAFEANPSYAGFVKKTKTTMKGKRDFFMAHFCYPLRILTPQRPG